MAPVLVLFVTAMVPVVFEEPCSILKMFGFTRLPVADIRTFPATIGMLSRYILNPGREART